MSKPRRRRRYDGSGRQERAAAVQRRMLDVARRLFAERGYAETTIEAIAEEAGMAVPTLYAAFRSKRGLLGRLLERLVAGEAPSVLQSAGAREVLAEPDPRRALTLFAAHISEIQDRVGPIFHVMQSAVEALVEAYASDTWPDSGTAVALHSTPEATRWASLSRSSSCRSS